MKAIDSKAEKECGCREKKDNENTRCTSGDWDSKRVEDLRAVNR